MELPGNKTHQNILQTLLNFFKTDNNIRSFILFGSLARGNWDKYSDLDLDVITRDISISLVKRIVENIVIQLKKNQLNIILFFEENTNEYVFIFNSLDRMSIRFHLLEDTHPFIIDSMKILYGDLTSEEIIRSQNKKLTNEINYQLLNYKLLEHIIYAELSIKRNQLMNTFFFINKIREILIEIYTKSRNKRSFEFENSAEKNIKKEITSSYSSLNKKYLEKSLKILMNLYRNSINRISGGKILLTDKELKILDKIEGY